MLPSLSYISFSLEFGFASLESNDTRQLLQRTVFHLDGVIARQVYKLEQARAKDEQAELMAAETNAEDSENRSQSTMDIRLKVYHKYNRMLEESIPPQIYLLLGHYQLLLQLYDDALSAYTKYESLVDEKGRRELSYLYGLAMCCFHFGAFNR